MSEPDKKSEDPPIRRTIEHHGHQPAIPIYPRKNQEKPSNGKLMIARPLGNGE
jgi:hypothetical protein